MRQRRDRAYLCKAEAQTQYRIDNFAILIKTRRESERVGKIEAESADRETRIVGRGRRQGDIAKCLDRPLMRGFGIEAK